MKEINKDMRNKELIEELISLWKIQLKKHILFCQLKKLKI